MPTNPDAVYLGHMASAIERIAELVGRIDRADFERDWTILGEAAVSGRRVAHGDGQPSRDRCIHQDAGG